MSDSVVAKKARVWNPAIDDIPSQNSLTSSPTSQVEEGRQPEINKNNNTALPMFLQSYLHLAPIMARIQQQRQLEQMMHHQQIMINSMAHRPTNKRAQPAIVHEQPQSMPSAPMVNPLVASAVGSRPVNENCCAVCGAGFRLTGDLVQHMRNNHRRTKFKRKNEKPIE